MKYKVGDKVHISNDGDCFDTYQEFFKQNNLTKFQSRFIDTEAIPVGDYHIIAIGEHKSIPSFSPIYVLDNGKNVYLVGDYNGYMSLIGQSLSTAEMFSQITESESYQRVSDGHIVTMKNGAYTWEPGKAKLSKDDRWIKVEDKEVSFFEAVKAYRDANKTIECRYMHWINQYNPSNRIHENNGTLYNGLRDQHGEPPAASEILDGKWFIKA